MQGQTNTSAQSPTFPAIKHDELWGSAVTVKPCSGKSPPEQSSALGISGTHWSPLQLPAPLLTVCSPLGQIPSLWAWLWICWDRNCLFLHCAPWELLWPLEPAGTQSNRPGAGALRDSKGWAVHGKWERTYFQKPVLHKMISVMPGEEIKLEIRAALTCSQKSGRMPDSEAMGKELLKMPFWGKEIELMRNMIKFHCKCCSPPPVSSAVFWILQCISDVIRAPARSPAPAPRCRQFKVVPGW